MTISVSFLTMGEGSETFKHFSGLLDFRIFVFKRYRNSVWLLIHHTTFIPRFESFSSSSSIERSYELGNGDAYL